MNLFFVRFDFRNWIDNNNNKVELWNFLLKDITFDDDESGKRITYDSFDDDIHSINSCLATLFFRFILLLSFFTFILV